MLNFLNRKHSIILILLLNLITTIIVRAQIPIPFPTFGLGNRGSSNGRSDSDKQNNANPLCPNGILRLLLGGNCGNTPSNGNSNNGNSGGNGNQPDLNPIRPSNGNSNGRGPSTNPRNPFTPNNNNNPRNPFVPNNGNNRPSINTPNTSSGNRGPQIVPQSQNAGGSSSSRFGGPTSARGRGGSLAGLNQGRVSSQLGQLGQNRLTGSRGPTGNSGRVRPSNNNWMRPFENQKPAPPARNLPARSPRLQYDKRLQAATLDEAVMNFPDLSNEHAMNAQPDLDEVRKGKCSSDDCKACVQYVSGVIARERPNWLPDHERRAMLKRLNAEERPFDNLQNQGARCPRIPTIDPFHGRPSDRKPHENTASLMFLKNCLSGVEQMMSGRNGNEQDLRRAARGKRQTENNDDDVVIKCVKRGESSDETDDTVSLCTQCWRIRRLEEGYFPRYVNELKCHNDDTSCFGGYGECVDHHRPVDLRKETGRAGFTLDKTIQISTCCDCTVSAQSPLLPFIQT